MAEFEYAGDLTPRQAWDILADDPRAALVDVRTGAEWSFVGVPDLSPLQKTPLFVEWQSYPSMRQNPSFVTDVSGHGLDPDAPILFLCRSGVRSKTAAIAVTDKGYRRCYNISDGFEGGHDAGGHRGTAAGWKAEGLSWRQK